MEATLWDLAALLVRNGIPRAEALKAVTLNAAEIIGLGDELGSIEEGKVGNIVVLSGDPLDFASNVEMVFIDGILAYERSRDIRLERLLGLEEADLEPVMDDGPAADDGSEEGGSADDSSSSNEGDE